MYNFISNWFQLTPIPADAVTGKYDLVLVGLSYIVAVLASLAALYLVERLRAERRSQSKAYWLMGGAFTMGAGIWSMHFIGMLAFILPMPMQYEFGWTSGSLIMAVLASGLALFILEKEKLSIYAFILGGIIIGLAISLMHYMGMEGMKGHLNIHYLPGLFFLSIVIGIAAAEAALYLALESNKGSNRRQFYFKAISAMVMGIAICGMHYTGMAAAVFTMVGAPHVSMGAVVPQNYLAFFVAGIAALIITITLVASSSYKKMMTGISNEKEFLKALIDNLDDGIIACDSAGRITLLNQSVQKDFNEVSSELNIQDLPSIFALYTKNDKKLLPEEYPLSRILNGEKIHDVALVQQYKNTIQRDVIVNGQQIINSEGEHLGALVAFHDVTALKRTEKLKNEFVSIVSHELRTPLTSIRGSLGLLVSGTMGEFPEKAQKLLTIANNNCERLLLLINDILDIEKIEAGKMEFNFTTVDVNQVVSEAVAANKMYAEKFNVTIEVLPTKDPILVKVDSGRLIQVFSNLISNACKFSPKNGVVQVSVALVNQSVRISVSDNGEGIPLEFQSRIFQKFSQADSSATRGKGGTGLGLNISKVIVEKLDGTLNFISEPGKGTTFYLDLPLAAEEQMNIPVLDVIEPVDAKKRLLICEDDVDQSDYLKALLQSSGFIVDTSGTVEQAKVLLQKHTYDALLLDLILPDQDGIAFIRELRSKEETKDLHIIVISVIADTGKAVLNGDALSVIDWFDKPINLHKLLGSINKVNKKDAQGLPRILHIEDNPDTQLVVHTLLEKYASVSVANTLQEAQELLKKNDFDLFIVDLMLPDGCGTQLLPILSQYHVPIVVFSNVELNGEFAKFVSKALIKANASNATLVDTIKHLL